MSAETNIFVLALFFEILKILFPKEERDDVASPSITRACGRLLTDCGTTGQPGGANNDTEYYGTASKRLRTEANQNARRHFIRSNRSS